MNGRVYPDTPRPAISGFFMVHLSKQPDIRTIQLKLLQWAKRLKYPKEYQESLAIFANDNKTDALPTAFGRGGVVTQPR